MRKEALGVACRTSLDDADMLWPHAGSFELSLIRRDQVEMRLRAEVAVSRRALIQEQHRILDVNCVGVEHFFEQLVGVCELRLELRAYFIADRIAALADARSDCCPEIFGHAAELSAHLAHALLDNPSHRSAPPSVKRAHQGLSSLVTAFKAFRSSARLRATLAGVSS